MRRRALLSATGLPLLAAVSARAQPAARTYRIGFLCGGTEASYGRWLATFKQALGELGYAEGRNVTVISRFADGKFDRLPAMAEELIRLDSAILLTATTPASLAAKAATKTIPIVIVSVADPVGVGLVESFARPGGNVTGFATISSELAGKRLEILKELVPDAATVAVLINLDDQNASLQMTNAEQAARGLGMRLLPVPLRSVGDLEPGFEAAAKSRARAALRMSDPLQAALAARTIELATKYRLPVMYPFREVVESGGLASYGASQSDQYRRAAYFVVRILQGTRPGDLPVERPTKFELVVNRAAASAIGLALPPSILARADEVID